MSCSPEIDPDVRRLIERAEGRAHAGGWDGPAGTFLVGYDETGRLALTIAPLIGPDPRRALHAVTECVETGNEYGALLLEVMRNSRARAFGVIVETWGHDDPAVSALTAIERVERFGSHYYADIPGAHEARLAFGILDGRRWQFTRDRRDNSTTWNAWEPADEYGAGDCVIRIARVAGMVEDAKHE